MNWDDASIRKRNLFLLLMLALVLVLPRFTHTFSCACVCACIVCVNQPLLIIEQIEGCFTNNW